MTMNIPKPAAPNVSLIEYHIGGGLYTLLLYVPPTLSNLKNLKSMYVFVGNPVNHQSGAIMLDYKTHTQFYVAFVDRKLILLLFNYGVVITKKRLDRLPTDYANPPPHRFFAFLATHEHGITDLILSYLDPWYCCNKYCTALLACWKSW